jgi:hypothetical protein
MDAINRHTNPAKTADDTQTAVVHDIRVELEHDRWRAGVEWALTAYHDDASVKSCSGMKRGPSTMPR